MRSKLSMFMPFLILINIANFVHALNADEWIKGMAKANETINFSGTYVVIEDDQTQTIKVAQRYNSAQNKYQQLIQYLNGSDDLLYSDSQLALMKEANGTIRAVPNIKSSIVSLINELPQRLDIIQKNYDLELKEIDRVANRPAQHLIIKPKDQYRYGYHLWLDEETGLVLRAAQIKQKQILAQFIFTEINFNINPMTATWDEFETFLNQQSSSLKHHDSKSNPDWNTQTFLGFTAQKHIKEYSQANQSPIEVIVFSDGLANITVFIEELPEGSNSSQPVLIGHETRGALTVLGAVDNQHQMMLFGDVPIETLKTCIENLKYLHNDHTKMPDSNTTKPKEAEIQEPSKP